jgi:hypothetical protein
MTDNVFGAILQSYYGSQVTKNEHCFPFIRDDRNAMNHEYKRMLVFLQFQLFNMCFELYYLARSGSHGNDSTLDVIGAFVVLFQNIYIFFAISLDAAYVNEEATKGLDILRGNGINADDNIHRKYLVRQLNLIYIYMNFLFTYNHNLHYKNGYILISDI